MNKIQPVTASPSPVRLPLAEEVSRDDWKGRYHAHRFSSSIAPASHSLSFDIPAENSLLSFVRALQCVEEVSIEHSLWTQEEIQAGYRQLEQLNAKREEAVRDHLASLSNEESWSLLGAFTHYFSSMSALMLGLFLSYQGISPSYAKWILASGALGVGSLAAKDLGIWDAVASWVTDSAEAKKKASSQIEMGIFFLSLMIAATSAWHTDLGALEQAVSQVGVKDLVKRGVAILGMGNFVFSAVARIGMGLSTKKLADAIREGRLIKTEMDEAYRSIRKAGETNKEMHELVAFIAAAAAKAIEESAHATN